MLKNMDSNAGEVETLRFYINSLGQKLNCRVKVSEVGLTKGKNEAQFLEIEESSLGNFLSGFQHHEEANEQSDELQDVDSNPMQVENLNFYLSALEQKLRCKVSEIRLTKEKNKGHFFRFEVSALANFFEDFQKKKEADKKMGRVICSLKAHLKEDQAAQIPSPKTTIKNQEGLKIEQSITCKGLESLLMELEDVKLQLREEKESRAMTETAFMETIVSLEEKLSNKNIAAPSIDDQLAKDLSSEKIKVLELENKLKKAEEALHKQQEEAKKTLETCQEDHQAELKQQKVELDILKGAVKMTKTMLDNEHLSFQQEKKILQDTIASHVGQLSELKYKNKKLLAALKNTEQQSQQSHTEKSSLLSDLVEQKQKYLDLEKVHKEENKMFTVFMDKAKSDYVQLEQEKAALLKELDSCRASYATQLVEEKIQLNRNMDALKDAEEKLENERAKNQEEKNSLLSDLEELKKKYLDQEKQQEEESNMFSAFMKKAKSDRLQWEQEKTSLLEELDSSRASYAAHLDEEKLKIKGLMDALKRAEQQLEANRLESRVERNSLLADLDKLRQKYLDQENMQHQERKKFTIHMKAEKHQAESNQIQWEQERAALLKELDSCNASYSAQLVEEKTENNRLSEALMEAEQQLESHLFKLRQATEQPPPNQESEVPKKKKWYKRMFRSSTRSTN